MKKYELNSFKYHSIVKSTTATINADKKLNHQITKYRVLIFGFHLTLPLHQVLYLPLNMLL